MHPKRPFYNTGVHSTVANWQILCVDLNDYSFDSVPRWFIWVLYQLADIYWRRKTISRVWLKIRLLHKSLMKQSGRYFLLYQLHRGLDFNVELRLSWSKSTELAMLSPQAFLDISSHYTKFGWIQWGQEPLNSQILVNFLVILSILDT